MSQTTGFNGCGGTGARQGATGSALLPASPFYAPRYHFGMLLGVDDFESEQAYHRGKVRLHNAWLHRKGVVWGLRVDAPPVEGGDGSLRGEVRVLPGLALDGVGRELFLGATACVSLPAWYEAHREDPELQEVVEVGEDGAITYDLHVVARFRACLSRPVPSISEPCVGSGGDTAYSRAQETIELLLRPGPAPAPPEPYQRLRLLFAIRPPRTDDDGIVLPEDQAVLDARAAILALPPEDQPAGYLDAFRRFAALDEMDLQPGSTESGDTTLFPEDEETVVVLADLRDIVLTPETGPQGDSLVLTDLEIDNTVRPSHVATATIQELLCGPLFSGGAAPGETPPPPEPGPGEEPPDAGAPRIIPESVTLEGEAVMMTADRPLSRASVAREAFAIWAYDNRDGWREVEIARDPTVDRARKRIRIELSSGFGGNLVRIIARGTGPAPLMSTQLIPLAGAVGGPPGTRNNGQDFVLMLKRSET